MTMWIYSTRRTPARKKAAAHCIWWVQTGRDLWGSYTQIRGGLTIDDYVAFPYGRDVVEGAHTQEATTDQLYNYGI